MAINVTNYATFNARLAQVVGAGSDSEVAGTMGRKLAINRAVGEDVFAKTGAHIPAEIGAIMSCLTALGDKVDWSTAVFMWDGPDDITRFCQHNQALFELVLKAVFSDNPPTGAGSTSTEITARQKASYEEISLITYGSSM